MTYTSKTKLPTKEENKTYYFLAGSMDFDSPDCWRKKAIEMIGDIVHFFDPTNIEHDKLNEVEMKEHIKWELDALALSDKIILNFLPNTKSPISLVELGLYVQTNKLIVVCPKEFYQKRYIEVLCNKYKTPLFENLDQIITQ